MSVTSSTDAAFASRSCSPRPGGRVVIVGAGIIGAACAHELARRGFEVIVIEGQRPGGGATAACMGHVVVMDDSEAQFALGHYSQQLWDTLSQQMPGAVERDPCGTLWVAEDEQEMAAVHSKHAFYSERGVAAEILDQQALRSAEPELSPHLLGALRVPGDSVVYPPTAVEWLLHDAARLAEQHGERFELICDIPVAKVSVSGAVLRDGRQVDGDWVILTAGQSTLDLLPEPLPHHVIRPRKGHLVITDRCPGFCRHQLVELGYLKSAHSGTDSSTDQTSVAFNLQPRATGQMLLGSSRQFERETAEVELDIVQRMIDRGRHFLPRLGELRAIRMWTGFRPATADHLPLIGPVPGHGNILLAAGHEGLGITTSLGTAQLIADHVSGAEPEIPAEPYLPSRTVVSHG